METKSIADFCPEYQEFVDWYNKTTTDDTTTLKMTGNQAKFANFFLENKDIVGNIGNLEIVFENVRKFLRNESNTKGKSSENI